MATPDGSTVASVGRRHGLPALGRRDGRTPARAEGTPGEVTPHHYPLDASTRCAISVDGQLVATGDKVGHVVVWGPRLRAGRWRRLEVHHVLYTWDPVQRRHSIGGVRALAFSPDGSSAGGRRQRPDRQHRRAPRGRRGSRSSTGERACGPTSSPARGPRGWSTAWPSCPTASGSPPSAAPTTVSSGSSTSGKDGPAPAEGTRPPLRRRLGRDPQHPLRRRLQPARRYDIQG